MQHHERWTFDRRSESSHDDAALSDAAAPTAGHAPIFFASGCDAPKPPKYTAASTLVPAGPAGSYFEGPSTAAVWAHLVGFHLKDQDMVVAVPT
ncbi:MAG: hypothetical protein AB8G14_18065 [Ilumatobacter sp.]